MSKEKLRQAMNLLQECMEEYQGDESEEGMESSEESYEGSDDGAQSMGANDKVKMAAALMKRK
jgi:hypothetical protein